MKALIVGCELKDFVINIDLGMYAYLAALCCVYLTTQTSELLSFWNSGFRNSVNVGLLMGSTLSLWLLSWFSGVLVKIDDITWLFLCKVFSFPYRFWWDFFLFEILLKHVLFDHFVIVTLFWKRYTCSYLILSSVSSLFLASLFTIDWALGIICRHTIGAVPIYPGLICGASRHLVINFNYFVTNFISFFLLSNFL